MLTRPAEAAMPERLRPGGVSGLEPRAGRGACGAGVESTLGHSFHRCGVRHSALAAAGRILQRAAPGRPALGPHAPRGRAPGSLLGGSAWGIVLGFLDRTGVCQKRLPSSLQHKQFWVKKHNFFFNAIKKGAFCGTSLI